MGERGYRVVTETLPGRKHLCLEEGTQSAWLYEILSPHVEEIVVAGINERNPGPKSDVLDAFRLAEELRTNQVKTPVFKAPRRWSPPWTGEICTPSPRRPALFTAWTGRRRPSR